MLRRCVGRSDRSAQGDRSTLRSIRPKRATFWSFHGLMESMEGPRKQPPNGRASPCDRRTGRRHRHRTARAVDGTRGDRRPGAEDGPAVLHPWVRLAALPPVKAVSMPQGVGPLSDLARTASASLPAVIAPARSRCACAAEPMRQRLHPATRPLSQEIAPWSKRHAIPRPGSAASHGALTHASHDRIIS